MSLGLLLLVSMPVLAQRMNECPVPGQVLHTDYVGETSDLVSASHQRIGGSEIPSTAAFTGSLRTRIYKNFRDRVCRTEAYQHAERVCDRISPDLALGRGNEVLASLYNLHNSTLTRAEIFSRNVKFQQNSLPVERLEQAKVIVSNLARAAAISGTPKSWEDFKILLQGFVAEGTLQQFVADDIIMVNETFNKRALGFIPLEGAIVTEGRGNGRLQSIFDLGITPEHRAQRINKLLTGIGPLTSRNLSQSFIVFAASNGIPSNWGQFVVMMKDARVTNAISEKELRDVTVDFEDVNRDAMGFQIDAQLCRMVIQTRHVNVIRTNERRNIDREISQGYTVSVKNAPLVAGEREVFTVKYDGFRAPTIYASQDYNSYRVSQVEEGRVMNFTLEGARKKVRPDNKLAAKLVVNGSISTVTLQNLGFNSNDGAKVIVVAKYYDGKLFRDKLLATETYELTDGSSKTITASLRNNKVDYVRLSMKIVGSPYYNSEFSEEIKVKN